MNMKKTMAAIAAGAVAVSAMATSVSALQDTTLTYNLVGSREASKNAGSVNIVGSVYAAPGADDTVISVGVDSLRKMKWNDSTGKFDLDGTYKVKNITVTAKEYDESNGTTSGIAIPFQGQPDNKAEYYAAETKDGYLNLAVGGTGKRLVAGQMYRFDVVITVEYNSDDYSAINSDIAGSTWQTPAIAPMMLGTGKNSVTGTDTPQSAGLVKTSDGTRLNLPFRTAATGNTNIIQYLQNDKTVGGAKVTVNGTDKNYVNVAAVLNDAIANYEGVVFKFNTATDGIIWYANNDFGTAYGRSVNNGDAWIDGKHNNYEAALAAAGGNVDNLTAAYSSEWYADTTYKSFTDHLYNGNNVITGLRGNYAGEGTGYTGFDWAGYNLFQGALIVNESLTMSLSDTEFFDWTATSISFDWDAIYSNAMTSNNFATYVQSLKLATSTVWYWDSMDVILTAAATEDASSGAGATGDDDTLDDNDGDDDSDISLDDDDDDSDVVANTDDDDDDDDADADANDTQAPAQTASNPQTGNASVALAVIPVALAAAAIVAKKRG